MACHTLCRTREVIEEPSLQAVSLDEGFQKLQLLGECVIGTRYNTEYDSK